MKKIFTLGLSLLTATMAVPAIAENPYAPTGDEVVKGELQTLYHVSGKGANTLSGSEQLGEGADGWTMQCMNAAKNLDPGNDITVNGKSLKSFKLSNGAQTTVTLPTGYIANAVTIYSTINKDAATDRPCYWSEVDGVTYTSDTDYLTSHKDGAHPDVSYYELSGDKNYFTLTNSGEQPMVVLVIDYTKPGADPGDERDAAPISWDGGNITYKVRDNISAITLPTLVNEKNLDLVFTSLNEAIATVDEGGNVTLKNDTEGTTVISAMYEATDDSQYKTTIVEYTIEVLSNVVEVEKRWDYPMAYLELDKIYAFAKDDYEGQIYADDYVTMTTASHSKSGSNVEDYGGYKFSKSIQVRVKSAPSAEYPYGEEDGSGSAADKTTSIIVKPTANISLYIFGRRQVQIDDNATTTEDNVEKNEITVTKYYKFNPNDGKSVKVSETGNSTPIDQEILLGEWEGDSNNYAYVITEVSLEAGKEYVIYALGTTYAINGIGYIDNDKDQSLVETREHVIEYVANEVSQTDYKGFTFSRTGDNKLSSGNAIDIDGTAYTSIKMKGIISNDEQIEYTLAAPKGRIITKATAYAYLSGLGKQDSDPREVYFSEVAGHTFVKDMYGKFAKADANDVRVFTFDHIMRNSFKIKLHSNQNDDICVVWVVETTHDRHAVTAPAVILEGEDEVTEEVELTGTERIVTVVPADGHHAYYHFDYAKTETVVTPEKPEPGFEESEEFLSPAPAPARAEAAGDAPAQVITVNGKEFRLVPEEGLELAKNGTLAVLAHNPANGLKSEVKTINVTGTAPETTMIESVAVDNAAAEVEYYNLQGIRVNNPQGGVFIRRQGNDVKKVIL